MVSTKHFDGHAIAEGLFVFVQLLLVCNFLVKFVRLADHFIWCLQASSLCIQVFNLCLSRPLSQQSLRCNLNPLWRADTRRVSILLLACEVGSPRILIHDAATN